MKVYPEQKKTENDHLPERSPLETISRKVAVGIAFVSVFFFFIKLLFF